MAIHEFPDREINPTQLNDELVPLTLPGFIGSGRLSRRLNQESGEWGPSDPHIIIKCDSLSGQQRIDVQAVIDAHVAVKDYENL